MFNKPILLFHHSFPLFNLFMSILMQSFVNSNLHVSTLYSLIIPKASEFESLKIVQLQASGTFSIMSIGLGRASIPQHVPVRLCSCLMNTKFSKILRFCHCFWVVHYRFALLFSLTFT